MHIRDNAIFESCILQLFQNKNGKSKSQEFWKRQDEDSSKLELLFVSIHTISKQNEMDLLLRDVVTGGL